MKMHRINYSLCGIGLICLLAISVGRLAAQQRGSCPAFQRCYEKSKVPRHRLKNANRLLPGGLEPTDEAGKLAD